jgi:hypothetical protein
MKAEHRLSRFVAPIAAGVAALLGGPAPGRPASPVVVELFQSQKPCEARHRR